MGTKPILAKSLEPSYLSTDQTARSQISSNQMKTKQGRPDQPDLRPKSCFHNYDSPVKHSYAKFT